MIFEKSTDGSAEKAARYISVTCAEPEGVGPESSGPDSEKRALSRSWTLGQRGFGITQDVNGFGMTITLAIDPLV